jgi:hypothetical protein
MQNLVILIAFLIVLFIVLLHNGSERLDAVAPIAAPVQTVSNFKGNAVDVNAPVDTPIGPDTRSFYNLTDGEKIQYIIDHYFLSDEERNEADLGSNTGISAADSAYVASLPVSATGCTDMFANCGIWSANNECGINPEFMLYNCPQSCQACSLNEDQKYAMIQIANKTPPTTCAYRGSGYPDRFKYLNELDKYRNDSNKAI